MAILNTSAEISVIISDIVNIQVATNRSLSTMFFNYLLNPIKNDVLRNFRINKN